MYKHNNYQEEEEDANLHILRHVLWHSLRCRLLWQTVLQVQFPLLALGIGACAVMVIILQQVTSLDWMIVLLMVVLLMSFGGCMVGGGSLWSAWFILIPVVILEPAVTTVMEAWQQARALTHVHATTVTLTSLVVVGSAAGLATATTLTLVRLLEAAAHALADRQGVYLRTNQEEWQWCLLVGIVACLWGPILVAMPWIAVHQTVMYLYLRANHTPEGYTRAELLQDLEQTRGILSNEHDDEEDVWCDEPIAMKPTQPTTTTNTAMHVEMTTYGRVAYPLHNESMHNGVTAGGSRFVTHGIHAAAPTEDPLRISSSTIV